jgi:hypothetical protein
MKGTLPNSKGRTKRYEKQYDTAVAIFSFNRPDYLQEVLASLEKNTALEGLDFYFFQDGIINQFSGRVAADEKDIRTCLKLWETTVLPNKHLVENAFNKGIGINQYEAKAFLFDEMKYEQVMFFEDDLVLSRNYVQSLRIMLNQFHAEKSAGIVMCHGGLPRAFSEFEKLCYLRRIRPGNDHLWGWGTWRTRWQKIKPDFLEYYKFIKDIDYRERNVRANEILSFYAENGFEVKITSQDAAIYYALVKNNLVSMQTIVHRGRYIGARGEHMTPKRYAAKGYADIKLPDGSDDGMLGSFEGYDEGDFLAYSKRIFRLV